MAQVTLSAIGGAIGGPVGAAIGAVIGGAIDQTLLNGLSPVRQVGSRLSGLKIADSAEGAPLRQVFGRARVAASVIWAARLLERHDKTGASKTSGPTESFSYSLSFAVGLCEGPIDGIGRIWADGQLLDQSKVAFRLYKGGEDQTPDALIEAVEGSAPAYRGLAYMVFEDLALGAFGNRPPSLSVEVLRRPRGPYGDLESQVTGVCLIPGAGEFVYGTTPVAALSSLTRVKWETQNTGDGRTDFVVALDQLQAALPACQRVNLVVSWFGTSLEAADCEIRPGVEVDDKASLPFDWSVDGVSREDAYVVSRIEGRPAYGGTPSDRVVVEAITELKARGFQVTLIPFILMDCAGYPWRGRISSSHDGATGASDDVAAFVGSDSDWGFRRFLRHCAELCVEAGGVEGFVLGSELRGLTQVRDAAGGYPFVGHLRDLAGEVRAILGPDVTIGYGADWSEYRGHQTTDGFIFHLDPLWSDENIDFVGIDWYAPLTDWREGSDHLDASFGTITNPDYLAARMRGGEGFEWYYASEADREAQVRTPIVDTAHGEDWVFRPKDVLSWWSNAHYDRPGGVRSATATDWVPQSKPIRFIEYGCGAIDKGPNAPNLFLDPKSTESAVPPFSTGERDDAAQAAYLVAFAGFYGDEGNNPDSMVYGGPMVEAMCVWCWDARPYPAFPQRSDLWGDADNWRTGHWLNGRVGAGSPRNLIADILAQAGFEAEDVDLGEVEGSIGGYVVEQPMRASEALSPVCSWLGVELVERGAGLKAIGRGHGVDLSVAEAAGFTATDVGAETTTRRDVTVAPGALMLRCYDPDREYQITALDLRRDGGEAGVRVEVELPLILGTGQARAYGEALLEELAQVRESRTLKVGPEAVLTLQVGDRIEIGGEVLSVRVVDQDEQPSLTLAAALPVRRMPFEVPEGDAEGLAPAVVTAFAVLDVPPCPLSEGSRPVVAVACDPSGMSDVYAGAGASSLSRRGQRVAGAGFGVLLEPLPVQRGHVLHGGASVLIRIEGVSLSGVDRDGLMAGGNTLCVQADSGEWELLQYAEAELIGVETWRLSGLIRGQWGTSAARRTGAVVGASVVAFASGVVRADMSLEELGLERLWRAGPAGFGGALGASREVVQAWGGVSLRPRAPVHVRMRREGEVLRLSWLRCSRVGGDGWEAEPPLGEDVERYRLRFLDGEASVRTVEVGAAAYVYGDAAVDYAEGFGVGARVAVAQWSGVVGWGAEAVVALG